LQYDSNEATDRLLDGDLVRNSVRHCCTVEVVRRRSREIVEALQEASSPPPLLNSSDSGTVSKLVILGGAENENLGGCTRPPANNGNNEIGILLSCVSDAEDPEIGKRL
jgi:hypothetical protein